VRARRHRRRAIKNGIEGVHFTPKQFTELIAKYNHRCVCCLKTETQLHRLGRKLVPDHVVPLSWGQPYSDEIENIQPLCSTCNNSKGARRATDYRKTFRLRLDILLNRA
jgi:5-methylcytosine-specific restriction endonuclease McrA